MPAAFNLNTESQRLTSLLSWFPTNAIYLPPSFLHRIPVCHHPCLPGHTSYSCLGLGPHDRGHYTHLTSFGMSLSTSVHPNSPHSSRPPEWTPLVQLPLLFLLRND
jgi:hypothetical protein